MEDIELESVVYIERNHGKSLKQFFFVHHQALFEMRPAATRALSLFRKGEEASDPKGEETERANREVEEAADPA